MKDRCDGVGDRKTRALHLGGHYDECLDVRIIQRTLDQSEGGILSEDDLGEVHIQQCQISYARDMGAETEGGCVGIAEGEIADGLHCIREDYVACDLGHSAEGVSSDGGGGTFAEIDRQAALSGKVPGGVLVVAAGGRVDGIHCSASGTDELHAPEVGTAGEDGVGIADDSV